MHERASLGGASLGVPLPTLVVTSTSPEAHCVGMARDPPLVPLLDRVSLTVCVVCSVEPSHEESSAKSE